MSESKQEKKTMIREVDVFNYKVSELLDRAYGSLNIDKGKITLAHPVFEKKDRKSYVHNFKEICESIDRDPEEVRQFLSRELQMETSFKENESLKIDQTVRSVDQIESILIRYVKDHVMCKSCRSCKTVVEKVDRIHYLKCNACKSRVAVERVCV
jgi:translation initiation factor 2 subunit 2